MVKFVSKKNSENTKKNIQKTCNALSLKVKIYKFSLKYLSFGDKIFFNEMKKNFLKINFSIIITYCVKKFKSHHKTSILDKKIPISQSKFQIR